MAKHLAQMGFLLHSIDIFPSILSLFLQSQMYLTLYLVRALFCRNGKYSWLTLLFKKKGDPCVVTNYRGLTLSCNLKKIFETVMATRFLKFLEQTHFFFLAISSLLSGG
jgi:hypothetical protein